MIEVPKLPRRRALALIPFLGGALSLVASREAGAEEPTIALSLYGNPSGWSPEQHARAEAEKAASISFLQKTLATADKLGIPALTEAVGGFMGKTAFPETPRTKVIRAFRPSEARTGGTLNPDASAVDYKREGLSSDPILITHVLFVEAAALAFPRNDPEKSIEPIMAAFLRRSLLNIVTLQIEEIPADQYSRTAALAKLNEPQMRLKNVADSYRQAIEVYEETKPKIAELGLTKSALLEQLIALKTPEETEWRRAVNRIALGSFMPESSII